MSRPPLSARLRSMRAAHVLLVAVAVVAIDMLTKGLAERHLAAARDLALGASLQLGHNDGVAFGFLGGEVPNIAVIALGVLITAVVAAIALRTSLISSAAVAGVLLGGAVANLIDRTPDGRVTDFIALPHWPTFNVADIAITLGVMAVLVTASRRPDQLKPTPPTPGAVTETS